MQSIKLFLQFSGTDLSFLLAQNFTSFFNELLNNSFEFVHKFQGESISTFAELYKDSIFLNSLVNEFHVETLFN